MHSRQLNTTSVYRRLSQIGLSVGLLLVVLNMWIDTATRGEQMQYDNTSNHIRLMLKQSAQVALQQITRKQTDALTTMLNQLTEDPFIVQSMVYDKTGKLIASAKDATTAHEVYLKHRTLADTLPPYAPEVVQGQPSGIKMYICEIMDGDKLVGYLRIAYLQNQALATPLSFHTNAMQQILLMMLLSGLIGFMLTRGFSRFSRQSYRIVDKF